MSENFKFSLCLIDTDEPIADPIADEVAGGGGQGDVGRRFRFTSERGRHVDDQAAEEKQRATVKTWIPGPLGDAASGLLRRGVFIKRVGKIMEVVFGKETRPKMLRDT